MILGNLSFNIHSWSLNRKNTISESHKCTISLFEILHLKKNYHWEREHIYTCFRMLHLHHATREIFQVFCTHECDQEKIFNATLHHFLTSLQLVVELVYCWDLQSDITFVHTHTLIQEAWCRVPSSLITCILHQYTTHNWVSLSCASHSWYVPKPQKKCIYHKAMHLPQQVTGVRTLPKLNAIPISREKNHVQELQLLTKLQSLFGHCPLKGYIHRHMLWKPG